MKTNCLLLILAGLFSMQAVAQTTTRPIDPAILADNLINGPP